MSYPTLLIYFTRKSRVKKMLETAAKMGRLNDTHVIGVYLTPKLELYGSGYMQLSTNYYEDHASFHRSVADDLKRQFEAFMEKQNMEADWRSIEYTQLNGVSTLVNLIRTVDLAIIEQADPHSDSPEPREFAERVLLAAGRPVLVIPMTGLFPTVGKTIFIASDGSFSSTRAVFDALPVLRGANSVIVHRIKPSRYHRRRPSDTQGDLVKTLQRHGVPATLTQSDAGAMDVGGDLLGRVKDSGADLMVMGAYGHSRLREYLIGGTTRHIIRNMSIPVMMSH